MSFSGHHLWYVFVARVALLTCFCLNLRAGGFSTGFEIGGIPGTNLFGTAALLVSGGVQNSEALRLNGESAASEGAWLLPELDCRFPVNAFEARFAFMATRGSAAGVQGFSFNWASDLLPPTLSEAANGLGRGLSVCVRITGAEGTGLNGEATLKWQGAEVARTNIIAQELPGKTYLLTTIRLETNGIVSVSLGAKVLFQGVALTAFNQQLRTGRFLLAAKSASLGQAFWVDDLNLTTELARDLIMARRTELGCGEFFDLGTTFSVVDQTMRFIWQKDGTNLLGSSRSFFEIADMAMNNSLFTLAISNSCGAITSNPVRLTVTNRFAPSVSGPPRLVLPCISPEGAIVEYEVSVFDRDECDRGLVPQSTPPSGSLFPPGVTMVRSVVTDGAGRSATNFFPVEIVCEPERAATFQGAQRVGGSYARGVGGSPDGSVYVGGTFSAGPPGGVDPFSMLVTNRGWGDAFVAKYRPSGALAWVRAGGGSGHDTVRSLKATADGGVIAYGDYGLSANSPEAWFGDRMVRSGFASVFIVKYDSAGQLEWIQTANPLAGSGGEMWAYDLVLDQQGNCLITGVFDGPVDFSGTRVQATPGVGVGYYDTFVAKYRSNGDFLWVRHGTSHREFPRPRLAVDPSGNAFVGGGFWETNSFGGLSQTGAARVNIFLAKIGPSGNVAWLKTFGGPNDESVSAISADSEGNVYLTGPFFSPALFQNAVIRTNQSQTYVVKLDPEGNVLWGKDVRSPNSLWNPRVEFRHATLYFASSFEGSLQFAGEQVDFGTRRFGLFAAALDPEGFVKWSVSTMSAAGSSLIMEASDAGAENELLLAGHFSQTVMFGETTLSSPNNGQAGFWVKARPLAPLKEQPRSVTNAPGENAVFWTRLADASTAQYQWQRWRENTWTDLPAETNQVMIVAHATSQDAAKYRVRVWAGAAQVFSAEAELSVRPQAGGVPVFVLPFQIADRNGRTPGESMLAGVQAFGSASGGDLIWPGETRAIGTNAFFTLGSTEAFPAYSGAGRQLLARPLFWEIRVDANGDQMLSAAEALAPRQLWLPAFFSMSAGQAETLEGEPREMIVPPGAVRQFATGGEHPGWLRCNGGTVPIAEHPYLFKALGDLWGPAPAGLFRLPRIEHGALPFYIKD